MMTPPGHALFVAPAENSCQTTYLWAEATQKPDESVSSFTSSVEQVQQRTCIRGLGHFCLSISTQIQNNQVEIKSVTSE